jgi:hypothetical protein
MIDEPLDQASARTTKPNSCELQITSSSPAATGGGADRARVQEVQDEVAVGHASIELGITEAKPSCSATMPRSVSKFTPASAPAPSGRRSAWAGAKARRSRSRASIQT